VRRREDILVHWRTYTKLVWESNASRQHYKIGKVGARLPGNNITRLFYFLQLENGVGGATEDGRNVPQRCRYLYGSGPAEGPGPQAV
jgi:hypothetical protein